MCTDLAVFIYMAPLPLVDQRHPWLIYQVEGYTKDIVHDYEHRLETIWGRSVIIVHILNFEDLTLEMRQDLAVRLRMVYTRGDGRQGQAHEKVTGVDLFYLSSMDHGTANVPRLLAQYLFRHAEGRKSGASLSGGHFIGRLASFWTAPSSVAYDFPTRGVSNLGPEMPAPS
nr:hypothetical protein [Tanacetum cinerariifolium]